MNYNINKPVTNLHSHPDQESEVISQALYGWIVRILEKGSHFSKVQTPDQYVGWVENKDLIEQKDITPSKRVKIIHNAAHVYRDPDTTTRKPLLTLPFEVELAVITEREEENRRWINVKLLDGDNGWIQRGDVSFDLSRISLKQLLSLSRQFLGLPYTWGGVSSFGYDCSGYVQMLFRQCGIKLPRDAREQIKSSLCLRINENEMRGGDLLFFGPNETKITHVALCLNEYELIHASVKPIPILQIVPRNDEGLKERFAFRQASTVCSEFV